MLARYIKMQLLVLLCGGLVGPIFLVVYFALGLGSLLSWMFYAGLIITVADVLIALALTNYSAQSAAKTAELEQSGVLALAQISGLTETGTRINDQPVVKVHLHISGSGFVPFDSEDRGSEVLWSMAWCPRSSPWTRTTGPTTSVGKRAR
ncbi:hypothetical protein MLAC_35020 [Mycobacterium lacus]|uniref:Uncharacterized protein n=1 Tax=Mycobacterium lacus TaxID=169765 RepID=A0A7I7NPA0_9MYCO|nr:hypothetical protein MLAC_35020 [Mycobacterium lacus]